MVRAADGDQANAALLRPLENSLHLRQEPQARRNRLGIALRNRAGPALHRLDGSAADLRVCMSQELFDRLAEVGGGQESETAAKGASARMAKLWRSSLRNANDALHRLRKGLVERRGIGLVECRIETALQRRVLHQPRKRRHEVDQSILRVAGAPVFECKQHVRDGALGLQAIVDEAEIAVQSLPVRETTMISVRART